MALHQRKMGRRSVRHAAPNTEEHRQDVRAARRLANARSKVIVSRPVEEEVLPLVKQPCLAGHGAGWQYIVRNGLLKSVPEDEFIAQQDEFRLTHDRYITERYDKKLQRMRKTTRKLARESPISQFGLTLAPPHGAVLKRLQDLVCNDSEKRASDLAFEILDRLVKGVVPEYERITQRIITGVGVHLDTISPHFHLQNTRINDAFQLVGDKGQGTSGTLFVLLRELKLGVIKPDSERARDFFAKMENYERQRGGLPVDIQLCDFVDEAFEEIVIGMFPGEEAEIEKILAEEKEKYRLSRVEQDAAALDKKEQELLADLTAVRKEQEALRINVQSPTTPRPFMRLPSLPPL